MAKKTVPVKDSQKTKNKVKKDVSILGKKKNSKQVVIGSNKLPIALPADKVFKACLENQFKFTNTSHLKSTHEIISQNRAVRAIEMGLGIRKPGYNIYVAGVGGTGKNSVIKTFLE
ncbi:AAA family ATPase, partial [Dolichospermum sp. ST_sed1]|nr:AAA family ATPase [Dolichospermum sp. ST_sed1]